MLSQTCLSPRPDLATSRRPINTSPTIIIRMDVSRRLLTEVMYQQKADAFQGADKSTLRCLTGDELQRYNVVNAD